MPFDTIRPYDAYVQGQANRLNRENATSRNALAQMEVEQAPRDIANRNALADRQQQQYSQDQVRQALEQTAAGAMRIAQSQDPQAEAAQAYPEFAAKLREQNPDWDRLSPDEAREYVGWIAGQAQSKLGIAPAAPAGPMSAQGKIGADARAGYLTPEQAQSAINPGMTDYQQQRLDIERQKLNQPKLADAGPLVQVAGPDGNPVYRTREQAVNQPAYVARDKPAAADVKWQREIKSKQPRLQAAIRRVERLAKAAEGVSKIWGFDGGPVDQYLIGGSTAAQELKAAAASLTPELTALTRVPGIGSQSDLETRLAGLQYPSTEFPPEVNAKAVAELQAFMKDLEDVYGSAAADLQAQDTPKQAGQAPQQAVEYLKANPQFKGAFRQKYGYLPDGI